MGKRVAKAAITGVDGKVYSVERPGRHCDVIMLMGQAYKPRNQRKSVQGFVLDDGSFVGRREAASIAIGNGQCNSPLNPLKLYSEDLW